MRMKSLKKSEYMASTLLMLSIRSKHSIVSLTGQHEQRRVPTREFLG
ncbi:hypothetical protein SALB1_0859 [Salinisphaera sp. LB1]|nr:hypothetical protein SALB1_0859 [Salinisphaera sp. LB1]